ncbi:MarR family transcriptional regulator [Puteibacter caeruleilacunae]|nr:MarR family transcriptional regulator [Puteibacter caeruleilacunae]
MCDLPKIDQQCCLFFTSNSLTRHISELAEEEFRVTGMPPSYAYLMLLVIDEPGLSQSELSKKMNLKPSTLTRFFDKLVKWDLVDRIQNGREINIFATEKGNAKKVLIDTALNNLFKRYCDVLGKDFAVQLTADLHKASGLIKQER